MSFKLSAKKKFKKKKTFSKKNKEEK
jgi:hypothetical protein